jgi:hypothetical protein
VYQTRVITPSSRLSSSPRRFGAIASGTGIFGRGERCGREPSGYGRNRGRMKFDLRQILPGKYGNLALFARCSASLASTARRSIFVARRARPPVR